MDDQNINYTPLNIAGYTDREILIMVVQKINDVALDVKLNHKDSIGRVEKMHTRIIPLEKFKDKLENLDIEKKAEESDVFVKQIKLTYKLMIIASGFIGALTGFNILTFIKILTGGK